MIVHFPQKNYPCHCLMINIFDSGQKGLGTSLVATTTVCHSVYAQLGTSTYLVQPNRTYIPALYPHRGYGKRRRRTERILQWFNIHPHKVQKCNITLSHIMLQRSGLSTGFKQCLLTQSPIYNNDDDDDDDDDDDVTMTM